MVWTMFRTMFMLCCRSSAGRTISHSGLSMSEPSSNPVQIDDDTALDEVSTDSEKASEFLVYSSLNAYCNTY